MTSTSKPTLGCADGSGSLSLTFRTRITQRRVSVRKTDTSQGPTVIPLALILSNGDHVPVHLTVPPMGRGAETSIKTKKYLISPPGETRFALIAAPNTYDNLYVFQVSGGAELWYAVGSSAPLIVGAVIGALAQRPIGA